MKKYIFSSLILFGILSVFGFSLAETDPYEINVYKDSATTIVKNMEVPLLIFKISPHTESLKLESITFSIDGDVSQNQIEYVSVIGFLGGFEYKENTDYDLIYDTEYVSPIATNGEVKKVERLINIPIYGDVTFAVVAKVKENTLEGQKINVVINDIKIAGQESGENFSSAVVGDTFSVSNLVYDGTTAFIKGYNDNQYFLLYKWISLQADWNLRKISENTTCTFKNGESGALQNRCYTDNDSDRTSCFGQENCAVSVTTKEKMRLEWKSSCGGVQYTTHDGNSETIFFDCGSIPAPTSTMDISAENITCIFENAVKNEECFMETAPYNSIFTPLKCSGVKECTFPVDGSPFSEYTVKSTCGDAKKFLLNGKSESLVFKCGDPSVNTPSPTPSPTSTSLPTSSPTPTYVPTSSPTPLPTLNPTPSPSITPMPTITPALVPQTSPFTDVSTTHQYASAIEFVRANGMVKGYQDGTFQPEKKISRAEFTKILLESSFSTAEIGRAPNAGFSDVSEEEWFVPYVNLAKEKGIIVGYNDNTFRAHQEISFAEASKILVNTLLPGQERKITSGENWWTPYEEVLRAKGAVPSSVKNGSHIMTRGEMAEMIYRILGK